MPDSPPLPPQLLETARLLLRKPRPEDARLIFQAYASDPEVVRYLTFLPHQHVRESEETVQRFIEHWETWKTFHWLVFQQDSQQLVGAISARREQGVVLGYCLARAFWGKGYMSEAVNAVVHWAFSDPSVFRVWAVCDLENEASARLLERNGFHQEGILRKYSLHPNVSEVPRDCFCYAKTRDRISDSPGQSTRD
ncbi:MAG TPA: GNAT family N-acetyltransferase [Chthoniobacterales bacterium]|nr:GNAT family N-acetyltransferase [Chthoniobacterales bacterium]